MGTALTLVWLALVIAAAVALSRVLCLCRVHGRSMHPTLRDGDWVLARRWLLRETPQRGEIVILHQAGSPPVLVKRIAATPDEAVPQEVPSAQRVLPPGQYILAGDDIAASPHQRFVGPVRREQIWGKVCLRLPRRR